MPEVLAAGAVLWRPTGGTIEVALVHRPRYDDWSLPKGKLEPGESVYTAAVREVAEETGHPCYLGRPLGQLRYPITHPHPATKVVDYFSARIAAPGHFQPSKEVDALRWLPLDDAPAQLSYAGDRDILTTFTALPTATTTLLLVRHAKAGSRSSWPGPDDDRPLSRAGRAQATRLSALLPLFGPTRVHSAPLVRCIQTVSGLGFEPLPEPLLSESAYLKDEPATLSRLRAIATTGGTPIVCSQGGVIPGLLSSLAKDSNLALPTTHTPKGSTWLLTLSPDPHPVLLAAHHIPAP